MLMFLKRNTTNPSQRTSLSSSASLNGGSNIHTNNLIRIPRKQCTSIGTPSTSTMRRPGMRRSGALLVPHVKLLQPQGIHNDLTFQIPNLDTVPALGSMNSALVTQLPSLVLGPLLRSFPFFVVMGNW